MLTTYLPAIVSTAQAYVGCSVVQVGDGEDSGTVLPGAVTLPQTYEGAERIYYDLHKEFVNGNIPGAPGPEVWDGSRASGEAASSTITAVPTAPARRRERRALM